MRRVETVRNNSRGRFVEKLDTDHSTDPRPRDDVRGHKIKHTKRVFLPIFLNPPGHPLAAADPLDALAGGCRERIVLGRLAAD